MEKSEPALVPEWLRSTGGSTGGGSSAHHNLLSSSLSDTSSLAHNFRNRTSKSIGDFDNSRSVSLNRTYSANSRRGSNSNGSSRHAYSSFSRSHRDRDRDKEKERFGFGDRWDNDSDPLGNLFTGRAGKEALRRSHSLVSRKQGELLGRKGAVDLKNSGNNNHYNGNGVLAGSTAGNATKKVVLDKDFPALGAEEKQVVPEKGRLPSSGLSTAVQSLPVGTSALIGGEGWSSALAEVPRVIGSGSMGSSSIQQPGTPGSASGSSSTTAGLNMAEALAQPPSRAQTPPQSSVTAQKLEELAVKQSRQLIPVTPTMPKISGLSSSDKLKPKTSARGAEINGAAKPGQQQPSSLHPANQFLAGGGHTKSDAPKKFLVLKPVWDNGVSSSPKDVTSPSSSTGMRVSGSQSAVAPPVASAPLRSQSNPKPSTVDRKVAASVALNPGSAVEKKPSSSQAQSRNDFFNLVRKKSLMTSASAAQESGASSPAGTVEKAGEVIKEVGSASDSLHVTENGCEAASDFEKSAGTPKLAAAEEKDVSPSISLYPEEEETRFLRSLGWDENAGEEEGLTEEEINAFLQEYAKLKPSLKLCRDIQLKLTVQSDSHGNSLSGASSEFGTSDSRSKA